MSGKIAAGRGGDSNFSGVSVCVLWCGALEWSIHLCVDGLSLCLLYERFCICQCVSSLCVTVYGMQGLKRLGVKEMTYKMMFAACAVQHINQRTQISSGGTGQRNSCHFAMQLCRLSR